MRISTTPPAERCYRLIDGGCAPHQPLDAQSGSLDDAIADAIAWVEAISDNNHPVALIGVEVSTTKGSWGTCRMPAPLLSRYQLPIYTLLLQRITPVAEHESILY